MVLKAAGLSHKPKQSLETLNVPRVWLSKTSVIQHTFCCICKKPLTLLEPPGFSDFRKKNSSFRLPYQRPSSSANCARELFSGSNGSARLVDCTRKKIFCLGGAGFL